MYSSTDRIHAWRRLCGVDDRYSWSIELDVALLDDVGEPRGKKLLYAYVVGEPNHP